MKLVLTTSPWQVPAAIELLESHGLHPRCEPGGMLEDGRVLPGQVSEVAIVVPDDEAESAGSLLHEQVSSAAPVPRSVLVLALVALTLAAVVIYAPVPAGPAARVAVTASVVVLVALAVFRLRRAARSKA